MTLSHQTRVLLVMTAQVTLSVVFIGGYFIVLYALLKGELHPPAEYKDTINTLMGVLTAGVGTILAYWFARQRGSDAPVVSANNPADLRNANDAPK
jgi:hypothetical protein